jgi:hypothetical protein
MPPPNFDLRGFRLPGFLAAYDHSAIGVVVRAEACRNVLDVRWISSSVLREPDDNEFSLTHLS